MCLNISRSFIFSFDTFVDFSLSAKGFVTTSPQLETHSRLWRAKISLRRST